MRRFLIWVWLASSATALNAADTKTINTSCENAINKSELIAAQRKWWPERPDPKANVVNVRTHGGIWSHEQVGDLVFQDRNGDCFIASNGHPADLILADLAKTVSDSRAGETGVRGGPSRESSPALGPRSPEPKTPSTDAAFSNSSSAPRTQPTAPADGGDIGVLGADWAQGEFKGVEIVRLMDGGSAQISGLHKGDVITQINGKHVHSTKELAITLAELDPGTRITIGYIIKTNLGWMPSEVAAIVAKAE